METGRAACFDGRTARRRDVTLHFDADALRAVEGDEEVLRWPYDAVRRQEAPHDRLTIGSVADGLARLEVDDPATAARIAALCPRLAAQTEERPPVLRILAWSAAAVISIALTVVYLVPIVAQYGAGLVPPAVERRLGDAVEGRVRVLMGGRGDAVCADPEGSRALARLAGQLAAAANLPDPPRIAVLPSRTKNAVALPGGRIFLLEGLLLEARGPDEVAGVLAHEIGHVAHRDGLKRMIQVGGTGYLLGLLFGDVGGAGVLVALAQTFADTSYSRAIEAQADAYAAGLMAALGRPATPLGELMGRLEGGDGGGVADFLRTHPGGRARQEALARGPNPQTGAPLLTPEEWAALRRICRATTPA